MNLKNLVVTVVVSAAVALAVSVSVRGLPETPVAKETPKKESAYSRVKRTNTLRCAWLLYPNFFVRDLNNGSFSGIYYDMLEEMGKRLDLKIEWTEEVGTTNAFLGLNEGRYDAICNPFTPTPGRARETEFSLPTAFRPYYAYARSDDHRFDNDYAKIDDPSVRLVSVEGEFAQTVAREKFPKAQNIQLPALTDFTHDELSVATGKADIALAEPATAESFMEKNPGKLHQIPGPPIYMCPATILFPVGEEALKTLINTTIETMHASGIMQKIYEKYLGTPGKYYFMPAAKVDLGK